MTENKLYTKGLNRLLLTMFVVSLTGCSNQVKTDTRTLTGQGILAGGVVGAAVGAAAVPAGAPLGAAVGGLVGGLITTSTAKQKTLLQRLTAEHIQIIEVGEQITLVLPAAQFFLAKSPAIEQQAYSVLNDVAMLLRTYPKTSVTIIGYTDNLGSSQRNVALSRQRAQATADYLWSQELDARLLYTEGRGASNPLADNSMPQGRLWNERIEITFQRLPLS